jgi:tRNA(Arg) A34 adenosine deaminase TadA
MESKFLNKACELALNGVDNNGGPFGCIITDNNFNEVSSGYNMVTSTNDPTAHAEIVAIRTACEKLNTFELEGYKLFTSCEPCPMCLSAIYWSRITEIYYANTRKDAKNAGFDDDFIYEEFKKDIGSRKIKINQINIDNSLEHFQKWSNKQDKIRY